MTLTSGRAAENEAKVLHFRRARLAEGVHVATVKLRPGETSLWHLHTRTRDSFYVVSGALTVMLEAPDEARRTHQAIWAPRTDGDPRPRIEGRTRTFTLVAGDVFVIEPPTVHCTANLGPGVCEFLCIEGVGEYDFVEVKR